MLQLSCKFSGWALYLLSYCVNKLSSKCIFHGITFSINQENLFAKIIPYIFLMCPWPRFNIKMTSYQYRKSHWGEKTILRPSYLHNGISYTGKTISLYWIGVHKLVMHSSYQAYDLKQQKLMHCIKNNIYFCIYTKYLHHIHTHLMYNPYQISPHAHNIP